MRYWNAILKFIDFNAVLSTKTETFWTRSSSLEHTYSRTYILTEIYKQQKKRSNKTNTRKYS